MSGSCTPNTVLCVTQDKVIAIIHYQSSSSLLTFPNLIAMLINLTFSRIGLGIKLLASLRKRPQNQSLEPRGLLAHYTTLLVSHPYSLSSSLTLLLSRACLV